MFFLLYIEIQMYFECIESKQSTFGVKQSVITLSPRAWRCIWCPERRICAQRHGKRHGLSENSNRRSDFLATFLEDLRNHSHGSHIRKLRPEEKLSSLSALMSLLWGSPWTPSATEEPSPPCLLFFQGPSLHRAMEGATLPPNASLRMCLHTNHQQTQRLQTRRAMT